MPRVLPFRGLRYHLNKVQDLARVVCPPYDVIGPVQRAELAGANPYNAVHLELPADAPGRPGSRYAHAAETLGRWREQHILVADPRPAYYLHETRFTFEGASHVRHDLIVGLGVEPWSRTSVLPHERTMAGPKQDRLELLRATRVNTSPCWVLSRDEPAVIAEAWLAAQQHPPAAHALLGDEEHLVWLLDDALAVAAIRAAFEQAGPLYIADGHHRYETALAFKEEAGNSLPGADAMLAVLTWANDPGLLVLPTHRVLRQLPRDLDLADLRQQWTRHFEIEIVALAEATPKRAAEAWARVARVDPPSRSESGSRGAAAGNEASAAVTVGVLPPGARELWVLRLRDIRAARAALPADRSDAWKELDLAVLHSLVIESLVERTGAARDDVLTYTRDPREVAEAARDPRIMGFLVNATRIEQVLAVADAGDRMPEKSTYFHPKPPTGLLIRDLTLG